MKSAISEKSFNTIKDIVRRLKMEIAYDKAHNIDLLVVTDFNGYNGINGINLANEIATNPDITSATNLQITYVDDGVAFINYADEDVHYDGGMTVDDVFKVMSKLVKLGRKGIAEREQKALDLSTQVCVLNSLLNKTESKLDFY